MLTRIAEFHSFLLGSLKMSDALIVAATAIATTIGLAIINKLMARPMENWKQASELRGELRTDLSRYQSDLLRVQSELANLRESGYNKDKELLSLKQALMDVNQTLYEVRIELTDCHANHAKVSEELAGVRMQLQRLKPGEV